MAYNLQGALGTSSLQNGVFSNNTIPKKIAGPIAPKAQWTGSYGVMPSSTLASNTSATSPKETFISSLAETPTMQASSRDGQLATLNGQVIQHGATSTQEQQTQQTQTPNAPSPLSMARDEYLSSLKPDTQVSAAKQKYLDFVNSEESGIAGLEGQGRGIPLQIIRGQQAKLAQQGEITARRLQGDVDLAQGNATQNQALAQAKLGFANEDVANNKPLTLGGNLVKLNPTTGKYETVYSTPDKAEEGFTLGEGQTRYGSDGKVIAQGPDKASTQKIVTVNGVDYVQGADGSLSIPQTPANPVSTQKNLDQLKFLKDVIAKANTLADAAGPNAITKGIGNLFKGDTAIKQLQTQTDTLKTNILSLMTDPNIKKFFGPQMSDADVRLMTSAGTTLNPYDQSPQMVKDELVRLSDLFDRMEKALKTGDAGNTGQIQVTDPEGGQHFFPDQKSADEFKKEAGFSQVGNTKASNSKVVAGYDLSTYATDPNHVNGIKTVMSKIDDVKSYVDKYSNSPINGNMIIASANKYKVDPKLLTALLVQESSLGTKGRAVSTKNPGNVGNTDSGAKKFMASWQEGVDAAAYQLARRKIG